MASRSRFPLARPTSQLFDLPERQSPSGGSLLPLRVAGERTRLPSCRLFTETIDAGPPCRRRGSTGRNYVQPVNIPADMQPAEAEPDRLNDQVLVRDCDAECREIAH